MASRSGRRRLKLGPIIGHTDHASTRIWIQVADDPHLYTVRVSGVGLFRFVSTEFGALEFGTAIAKVTGLRPDRIYQYQIFRRRRFVPATRARFRTMPDPSSMTDVLFTAISCNSLEQDGVWERFAKFVEDAQPTFLLMMGDQVYIDEDDPDVFKEHFDSSRSVRRQALAAKYQLNWSRDPVRRVLSTTPTYMMWDDHDIRDGWGSFAQDSPTLVGRFPRGQEIHTRFNEYFEDARDVYWHFQGCHNPIRNPALDPLVPNPLPNYIDRPPAPGQRRAMPFVFRCGRILVLVIDSRGERDIFRERYPVLGSEQWQFVDQVFANISDEVEAIALVTPTPIASMDPEGQVQKLLGQREDDVELFKRGDFEGLLNFGRSEETDSDLAKIRARITGSIDEARDQWSHHRSRPEQQDLIRKAGFARLQNRTSGTPRNVIFLSGDIHVGGIYDVTVSKPKYRAPSLISSGISKESGFLPVLGVFLDEDFDVAPGIHSSLRHVVNTFNFGVVHVIPTGTGAKILGAVAHEGNSFAVGVDLTDLLD